MVMNPKPAPTQKTDLTMKRVFVAGATGVMGQRLVPLLQDANYLVTGTTRSPEKAEVLRAQGVEAVVVDMFDAEAVVRTVIAARPDVLIHQLTDLPKTFDAKAMEVARARNARLRAETAPTLMRAAAAAGVRRVIVQSICFAYAPGALPHFESDPLDSPSVQVMETAALTTKGIEGVILRYGRLWGPGTWTSRPAEPPTVHVDAAAHAALLAITRGEPGIYNIAEDDGTVATTKARTALGFDPTRPAVTPNVSVGR
jgi:nucleoside-diphosphate-sugar epimerase